MHPVKIPIRNIGNSRGIIIPSAVMKQVRLTDEVELEVEGDRIVIQASRKKRDGWFDDYDVSKDGVDRIQDVLNEDVTDEWTW